MGVLYDLIIEPLGWVGLVDSGGKWTLIYHNVMIRTMYLHQERWLLIRDTISMVMSLVAFLLYERSTTAPIPDFNIKQG